MMGEPIYLYNRNGEAVTVFSRSQVEEMRRIGAWYYSPEEAQAAAGAMDEKTADKPPAKPAPVVTYDDAPKAVKQPAPPAKTTRGKGKGI